MAAVWFYVKNGARLGPITAADLKKLADDGSILPADMVWKEGMASWEPARSVKGLFEDHHAAPDEARSPRPAEPGGAPAAAPVAAPTPLAAKAPIPARPLADMPSLGGPEPDVERRAAEPVASRAGGWLALTSLLLAAAAFALALFSYLRGTPGSAPRGAGGIDGYDFSSPQAAIQALWRMKADNDVLARAQYRDLCNGEPKESVDSLKVKETLTAGARSIVLFSYQRDGKEKRDYRVFVKHPGRNIWLERDVDISDLEAAHADIARRLREWRSKTFDPLAAD